MQEKKRNPEADAAEPKASSMTNAEKDRLAVAAAKRLLAVEKRCVADWIEKGRIIHEYVKAIRPGQRGEWERPDPYKRLAQIESIPWEKSQIENYEGAYILAGRLGFGKKPPKGLTITHFSVVLPKWIPQDRKESLLRAAQLNGWSVRDLREKASEGRETQKRPTVPANVPTEWKSVIPRVVQLNKDLVSLIARRASKPCPKALRKKLVAVRNMIDALLGGYGKEVK